MNWLEFFSFVAATLVLAGYSFGEFRRGRQALLLTAVFLSLESTTQFMTIDAINDLIPAGASKTSAGRPAATTSGSFGRIREPGCSPQPLPVKTLPEPPATSQ